MRRRVAALLAVALLGGAACGDSADSDGPGELSGGDAAGFELRATDFAFDPTTIDVDPGQEAEVTFVNAGNVAHSFTVEALDVDVEAESGDEVAATFTAPDEDTTIEYVCRFHPSQMKGEIVVGDGGSGAGGGSGGEDSGESDDFDY